MKYLTAIVALATTYVGVSAGPVPPRFPNVCGYWLVNSGGYTQSDIAQLTCGRTDTCDGQEWNTVFHMGMRGDWGSAGFCSNGCYMYEEGGWPLGACH